MMEWQEQAKRVLSDFEETGRISTATLHHATSEWLENRHNPTPGDYWEHNPWFAAWVGVQRLVVLCNEFDRKIWDEWLREYYLADEEVGSHAGMAGEFEVLMLSSAGRLMITIQGEDSYISFITEDPDSPCASKWMRLGVQGVDGELEQIEAMVRSVLDNQDELRETMTRRQNYLA